MKNLTSRLLTLLLLAIFCPVALLADPPAYAGSAFDKSQELTDDGLLFFGVIIAGAVIVTGFFKGRQWLKKV